MNFIWSVLALLFRIEQHLRDAIVTRLKKGTTNAKVLKMYISYLLGCMMDPRLKFDILHRIRGMENSYGL